MCMNKIFKKIIPLFVTIIISSMFVGSVYSDEITIPIEDVDTSKFYCIGDTGKEVMSIQKALSDVGYDIYVDGDFGEETFETVTNFQISNDLIVDGIVGEETLNKLSEVKDFDEVYVLARVIFCESGSCSIYTQWLVGSASYNLVHEENKSYFDPMVFEINFYEWSYFDNNGEPSEIQLELARQIIKGNRACDIRYYRTDHYHDFGTPVLESDNMYFSMP